LFINKRRGVMNNWLNAIKIAKVLFWADGYHTKYLEELERYIRQQKEKEQERQNRGK